MTFIRGDQVELRVLQANEFEVQTWTNSVMSGLTTEHLFTGSVPMRGIDVKEVWEKERKAGDVLFAVYQRWPNDPARSPRFIGTCGLHSHREIYRSWESRFLIFDADSVGKGLGKEVCSLLTAYAFRRLNAHRVWLGVSEDNKRAVKCYLDCGYIFEGRLRDEIYYGGKYHAALRFGVLEDEWTSLTTAKAESGMPAAK